VVLKHHAEVAAQVGSAALEYAHVLVVHQHATGIGTFNAGDEFEQIAFACPGVPLKNTFAAAIANETFFQCSISAGICLLTWVKEIMNNYAPQSFIQT